MVALGGGEYIIVIESAPGADLEFNLTWGPIIMYMYMRYKIVQFRRGVIFGGAYTRSAPV